MSTRYYREKGKNLSRFAPHNQPDVLFYLRQKRGIPTWSAGYHLHYLPVRQRAMRPVLGQLRMIEAAIRCDIACREAVQAWRAAA